MQFDFFHDPTGAPRPSSDDPAAVAQARADAAARGEALWPDGPDRPAASKLRAALRTEGKSGVALRTAVALKYVTWLLTIVAAVAISHACLSTAPAMRYGGIVMLFSITLVLVTGAVGTWFFPPHRMEIIEQMRRFAFSIIALPGTSIALFIAMLNVSGLDPTRQDMFISLLDYAVPMVYVATVVIPSAVFVKMIAGYRTIHTHGASTDDFETARIFARQDGLQR